MRRAVLILTACLITLIITAQFNAPSIDLGRVTIAAHAPGMTVSVWPQGTWGIHAADQSENRHGYLSLPKAEKVVGIYALDIPWWMIVAAWLALVAGWRALRPKPAASAFPVQL